MSSKRKNGNQGSKGDRSNHGGEDNRGNKGKVTKRADSENTSIAAGDDTHDETQRTTQRTTGDNRTQGAGAAKRNSGEANPTPADLSVNGTAPRPSQKSADSPNGKSQRRLRCVDARALTNLLCWSIDLIDRQRNLLRTALDVLRDPEQ